MMGDIVKRKVGRPSMGKSGTFSFRVRAGLREKLEAAATSNQRSISEEIEIRISRSLTPGAIVAEALGGHEMRNLAVSAALAFAGGASLAAKDAGHADWTAAEWSRDRDCYRAGIIRAMTALLDAAPSFPPEEMTLLLFGLKNRMATSLVRSGHLKFDFADNHGPRGNEFVEPEEAATEPSIRERKASAG